MSTAMNANIEGIFNLSPLQEGMLFHSEFGGQSGAYIVQTHVKSDEDIDLQSAQNALALLAQQHDVLRSVVFNKNGHKPRLIILKNRLVETPTFDIAEDDIDAGVENIKQNDINRGFNLEKDSLLRVTFIRHNGACRDMVWTYHHIIIDGWSMPILLRDFCNYYVQLKNGASKGLIQPSTNTVYRYGDYLKWLDSVDMNSSILYWKNYLADYASTTIVDYGKVCNSCGKHAGVRSVLFQINECDSERISRVAASLGVTSNTIIK